MGEKTAEGEEPMKSAPLFVRSSSPNLYAKKGVALHLYSKGVATPSLPVLSLFSPLCTLTAQVEAGVGQLKIYTFLAFILQHTELTSINGALLTPFNSCLKQVLLAQLTRKGQTAPASARPCCISTFTPFFFMEKKGLTGANKLLRRMVSHVASLGYRCIRNI